MRTLVLPAIFALARFCWAAPTSTYSQATAGPDPFEPIAFMVGRWEESSEGQPGRATVRREYARTLGGRFIHVRNRSEYPVQEKNRKGEVHKDEGFFSFDRTRKHSSSDSSTRRAS